MAFLPVLSMILIGSCQSSPEALSGKTRKAQHGAEPGFFKTTVKSESVPLSPEPGYEGPRMLILMAIQNIPVRGELGDIVRDVVFGGSDYEAYGEEIIAYHRSRYLEAGKQALAEGTAPSEFWNWEYSETVEGTAMALQKALAGINGCFVVHRSREHYLGGAHGMREERYFLFDMEKNRQIVLADIVRENAGLTLRQLAAVRLRERAGLDENAPLSRGGFSTDLPEIPENFFLTPVGLGFHWDPYEIAPYAAGPVEIIIPYEELEDTLRW